MILRPPVLSKALKEKKERKERKERTRSAEKVKVEVPTDILHPELYRALSEWRTAKTREMNVPAYVIMQQKALMGIVNLLPDSPKSFGGDTLFWSERSREIRA